MRLRGGILKLTYYQSKYFLIAIALGLGISTIVATALDLEKVIIASLGVFSAILFSIQQWLETRKEGKEVAREKLNTKRMKNIDEFIGKTKIELDNKQKVMREFILNAVIKESDVIENLNSESFTIIYHFNRKIYKRVEKKLPNKKKAIDLIIKNLNFVPIGASHGGRFLHIINTNALPKELREISDLRAYIEAKVIESWQYLDKNTRHGSQLQKELQDNPALKGNLIYLLGKIFPQNMCVGQLNFSSFDYRFINFYSKFVNPKTINIDTKRLKSFIQLASIIFLAGKIPKRDKEKLMKLEWKIKKSLKITDLFDFESVDEKELEKLLTEQFSDEKARKYSTTIKSHAKQCGPIIKEFC